jgi:SAM-dependent methyltransferase
VAPSAEQPSRTDAGVGPEIARFLGEPTRELGDWRWLWDGDHRFPVRSHRGLLGRFVVFAKRLLRPFVAAPQADLWERQRIFNLIALEYLQRGEDIRRVVLETHGARLDQLERVWREGLNDVMAHNDALFARVDQKLDRVRREARDVWSRLGSALAVAEQGDASALSTARGEHTYLELEQRFRGTEDEISTRATPYVELLRGKGEVLDLGCGRGEALALFAEAAIPARGVDSSAAMVEECRRKGLEADHADLFDALAATGEGSLGGVISLHVIEHLPADALDRLTRLAWRALAPGGLLVFETPNPLSVVVAARNFWLDPTHQRPVHPETLDLLLRQAGFDPVERIELRPFPEAERLPEIPLAELGAELRPLAHRVNELRDVLDDLLFGYQDYALVGTKPA